MPICDFLFGYRNPNLILNYKFRDYWSQHQEVGANWVDGKYGYKNGWSVPLVQSLGVEGGQHNTVSVPLTGPNAGSVMVDNGYKVIFSEVLRLR